MSANHKLGACSTRVLQRIPTRRRRPAPPRKCLPHPLAPPGVTRPKSHMVAKKFLTFSGENRCSNRPTQRQF